ncbi:hypothetical protein GE061_012366 [Apolygus lucorum]|uniref:Uncharacterized protein n=1 Tax=Apolygus lucorum TaxID=248454 RepID=A0A8S9XS60_APOLU|nr:hypothetical protein GE061_012366 [Apolygus lucorum]
MTSSGPDIRRLISKRLDEWVEGRIDGLVQEAERCDRGLRTRSRQPDQDHKIRVFTRLVHSGRLREATRWITDRAGSGGVLQPESVTSGQTVLEVLESKHPPQSVPGPEMFLDAETMPSMSDVDVTERHIAVTAHRLNGSAGPSGTDAEQWRSMLLRYGAHSTRLRETVAGLTRCLANGVVEWNKIKALLARRGIALDKAWSPSDWNRGSAPTYMC